MAIAVDIVFHKRLCRVQNVNSKNVFQKLFVSVPSILPVMVSRKRKEKAVSSIVFLGFWTLRLSVEERTAVVARPTSVE